jgi:choline dehydrogenase
MTAPAPLFDTIIVGGGTAGCVLANRLSEDPSHRVLLLEAGPPDRYVWIHIPIGYAKTMFHKVYNWGFYTEPDPGMNNRKVYWPRGRGLGGSSSINGLIYVRGQREDYDAWAQQGNAGWAWDDVLPYFIRSERNSEGASAAHGADGPLACTSIKHKHPLMDAIIRGANELGVPTTQDFNGGNQEGVGYYQLFTRNGLRCSTAVGYLNPARGRRNLTIETNAHVSKILWRTLDNGQVAAAGVEFLQGGVQRIAHASREVVLCAGALQSPQLLQLSGVGDAAFLQSKGIAVQHHLPGVGENLQDHLQLRLMFKVKQPITTNDLLRSPIGKLKMGIEYAFTRGGPMAVGINQGGLFTAIMPGAKTPDIQFHFASLSADMAGGDVHPWSGCTFSVCQLRPSSRGHVRIQSPDPMQAPAMQPFYLSTDIDRECAVRSLKYARTLARTKALAEYIGDEYRPGAEVQTEDELLAFARQYGATIFHPSGTCKMAPANDPRAVVDERLRVRGLSGLRVVDCSIMPTLVSGNTNAPVVMIAEKAASMMKQDAALS